MSVCLFVWKVSGAWSRVAISKDNGPDNAKSRYHGLGPSETRLEQLEHLCG